MKVVEGKSARPRVVVAGIGKFACPFDNTLENSSFDNTKVRSCLGDKLANELEWQLELHRRQQNRR